MEISRVFRAAKPIIAAKLTKPGKDSPQAPDSIGLEALLGINAKPARYPAKLSANGFAGLWQGFAVWMVNGVFI